MIVFGFHEVAFASAVYSTISLIVTLLAIYTQRQIYLNRQCVLVKFTVMGLTAKDQRLQTKTKGIMMDIANILGLHHELVYIEQPRGFRFKVNLYINYVQYKGVDYESLMEEAVSNGTMGEILRNHWKLPKVPAIADLKYEELQSEFQLMNMVEIFVPRRSLVNHIQLENNMSSEPEIVYEDEAEGVRLPGMPKVVETPFGPFDVEQGTNRARTITFGAEEGMDTKTKK